MFSPALLLCSVFAVTNAFVHDVYVSNKDAALVYTPAITYAKRGDFVNFHFSPKNHTVTQSSFNDPCNPLQGGFDSGFKPVAANLTRGFPFFTVPVLDHKPIWFYCQQGAGTDASHCVKGMVGAINPPTNSFDQFKQKAQASAGSQKPATSSPPSTQSSSKNYTVNVSDEKGTLAFSPPVTNAQPGDFVTFNFFPKNHTVTQSSFDDPCTPVQSGFNSGFQPVAPNLTGPRPTFTLEIKTTDPVYFYCAQGAGTPKAHCSQGMVGAINADQTKFDQFKQSALGLAMGASGSMSTTAPVVHNVVVSDANASLIYTPPVTYAKAGEIVRFTFNPKNHTVTQSSFADPCSPLQGGITSGFRPVSAGSTAPETFDIVVKDENPIWLYCAQGARTNATHCGRGMVAAINPTQDKSFDQFKQNALAVGASLGATTGATPSAAPKIYEVQVGGKDGSLVYDPPVVNAKVGDSVKFTFTPKNHTVTQSSFDHPCMKIDGGIASGFQPVAPGFTGPPPTFIVNVTDTNPKWFYCGQGAGTSLSHCGKGMVFALNPSAEKTFDAFQQKALAVGVSLGAVPPPKSW